MKSREEILHQLIDEVYDKFPDESYSEWDMAEHIYDSLSPKWIKIEERLPEPLDNILVCLKNRCIFMMGFDGTHFFLIERAGRTAPVNNPVTHWMKLPEPPKED